MTKREKRLNKIRRNQKQVSKDELHQLLLDYGFQERGGKGSHTVYQHPIETAPIIVAAHGKHVPAYIVKQALEAVDRILEREERDELDD